MSATIVSLNLIVIPEVRNELSGIHVRHTQYNRPETGLVRVGEILREHVCDDQSHRHTRSEVLPVLSLPKGAIWYPCSTLIINNMKL